MLAISLLVSMPMESTTRKRVGTPRMIWTMLSSPWAMVSSPLHPTTSSGSSRTPGPPTGATTATFSCLASRTTVGWQQLLPLPQSNDSVSLTPTVMLTVTSPLLFPHRCCRTSSSFGHLNPDRLRTTYATAGCLIIRFMVYYGN